VIVLDLVFLALVVGFFALAAVFVRACRAIVGPASGVDEELEG
jgi:hypothetical protein